MELPYIKFYPELITFMKDHNISFDYDSYDNVWTFWLINTLHDLGYSIEVSEMSTADNGNMEGKRSNWKRLNKYRWLISCWDKEGYLISNKYSDTSDRDELTSIDMANEDAINYIVNNYKELEKCS